MKNLNINKSLYITTILIFFILLLSLTAVNAKTYYTWVDSNGVTHITEFKDEIPKSRVKTAKTFRSKGGFDFITTKYIYLKSNIHIYTGYIVFLLIGLFVLIVFRTLFNNYNRNRNQKKLNKTIKNFDSSGLSTMNSYQFKSAIRDLLENMGYRISAPNSQFVELIDYIGFKAGKRVAISLNESENLVSKIVVSEVDRERQKHQCEKSMIICKTYFEEDVIEFAKSVDCELIDRERLSQLLIKN
ncbi:MAG: restriction endonuclease [Thermodesulfobacteriota bacterium]